MAGSISEVISSVAMLRPAKSGISSQSVWKMYPIGMKAHRRAVRVCLFIVCLELYDFIDASRCSHYGLVATLSCSWVVAVEAHTVFSVYAEVDLAVVGAVSYTHLTLPTTPYV